MNAEQSTCASSGKASAWDQTNWPKCARQVRRLQARIVKATQASRWNKVKTLQRLLTCSFSGKALAVKRVTDNTGRTGTAAQREVLCQADTQPESEPHSICGRLHHHRHDQGSAGK